MGKGDSLVSGDKFIFVFAETLKENADNVLNGEDELVLNTDWVAHLNSKFPECDRMESFSPATYDFSQPDHEPLAFLFEFFQMVPRLKIIPGPRYDTTVGDMFDLSHFRSVVYLKLIRVDANRIYGIQRFRAQLQAITCRRSVDSLTYLFSKCAADMVESDNPWSALQEVDCASNSIVSMGAALALFPQVKKMDLSDNSIEEVTDSIRKMNSLMQLGIGYNHIVSIAAFFDDAGESLQRLSELVLCNNNIASLHGLQSLNGLTKLDVSRNEIQSVDEFKYVQKLKHLKYLWTEGNPVAFEKHYRARVLALFPEWHTFKLDGRICEGIEEQLLVEHYLLLADAAPKENVTNYVVQYEDPPTWEEADRCYLCSVKFSWRYGDYPRHHCRQCGRSVCQEHSGRTKVLAHFGKHYQGPQRVCDPCFSKLQHPAIPTNDEAEQSSVKSADTPVRTKTRRRPKSADIAEHGEEPKPTIRVPDAEQEIQEPVAHPKSGKKRKKKKKIRRRPTDLLEEQDSLREQVDQIFETGGPNALAIYQAWVDQNAEKISPTNSESDGGECETPLAPPDSPEKVNNAGPVNMSTPRRKKDQQDAKDDTLSENEVTNQSQENVAAENAVAVNVQPEEAESEYNSSTDEPMFKPPEGAQAESTAEFLVDLYDRTNQTCSRIIQVQGKACIMVIDFITGKTVDMVDLTCLIGANVSENEENNRPVVKLTFVYGPRDRRSIEFLMENEEESDEIRTLLEPIIAENKSNKLSDSVNASFKCLKCENVFEYEEHRFQDSGAVCPSCQSNQVVEFYFNASAGTSFVPVKQKEAEVDNWVDNPALLSIRLDSEIATAEANAANAPEVVEEKEVETHNSPYSDIKTEPPIDCRAVDHNRKLFLDLEYFDDSVSERCLGGIECRMWVPSIGEFEGFVACSSKSFYAFEIVSDGALDLIMKYGYESINHLEVSMCSQRLRIIHDGTFLDIFPGSSVLTWELMTIFADNPLLWTNYVHIDATFSRAIETAAPDIIVKLQAGDSTASLGCMHDMVSDMNAPTQMRELCEPAPEMDLHFASIVQVEGYPSSCLLLLSMTSFYLLGFQHDAVNKEIRNDGKKRASKGDAQAAIDVPYPYTDALDLVACQEITDVQTLEYDTSFPRQLRIRYWNEDGRKGQQDCSWNITMRSSTEVRGLAEKLNQEWEPNYGIALPLEMKPEGWTEIH